MNTYERTRGGRWLHYVLWDNYRRCVYIPGECVTSFIAYGTYAGGVFSWLLQFSGIYYSGDKWVYDDKQKLMEILCTLKRFALVNVCCIEIIYFYRGIKEKVLEKPNIPLYEKHHCTHLATLYSRCYLLRLLPTRVIMTGRMMKRGVVQPFANERLNYVPQKVKTGVY